MSYSRPFGNIFRLCNSCFLKRPFPRYRGRMCSFQLDDVTIIRGLRQKLIWRKLSFLPIPRTASRRVSHQRWLLVSWSYTMANVPWKSSVTLRERHGLLLGCRIFCNIMDGNRVRSGMCAFAHLHRSMLAHIIICFVGSALLPWLP